LLVVIWNYICDARTCECQNYITVLTSLKLTFVTLFHERRRSCLKPTPHPLSGLSSFLTFNISHTADKQTIQLIPWTSWMSRYDKTGYNPTM